VSETRKLAAILVADIVGYSRLASTDEDRTLARVRGLRSDLIDPAIAAHHGRIVKRTGDGAIIEFRSVVDAVRCAIEVQNGLIERNAGVPEDKRIQFRVGIHVGDVVEESDGDLMGDGVNIAARLEGIAKPGAICLSEDAYRQVKQRLDLKVTDLGATQLKNIAEPIRAYSVEAGVPAQAKPPASSVSALASKARSVRLRWSAASAALAVLVLLAGTYVWRSGLAARMMGAPVTAPHLSIVVLPFANLSSDPEQDYFADAITDDLTTDLSHLPDSFVIARNTAFTYKGKAADVKEIGRDLGVRYALEGSVRRIGEDITINAQLVSTDTGAHVWADRFEGERAKLGQLQMDVVARLANSLGLELVRAEALRATRERPDNPDAVDLALRGLVAIYRFSPASNKEAVDDFERALKLDPELVRAKLGLSAALSDRVVAGWSSIPRSDAERAERLADEALSAEPGNAIAHFVKALVYQTLIVTKLRTPPGPEWEAGIAEADAATNLDRNFAGAHAISGYWRLFLGRAAEGFVGIETAMKLSPRDPVRPVWESWICHLHSHLAQWEQAIEHCRLAAQGAPYFWFTFADLVAANAWLGRDEEAKTDLADLLRLKPDLTAQSYLATAATYSDNAVFTQQIARMVEGMRKAGLPEGEAKTN
jgi:class 3 adenylate cyclase/TolB-like protein